jgi:acyl carrier protein
MFSGIDSHYLLIGVAISLAVAAAVAVHLSTRSKARRVIRGRSPLSATEFGALFKTEAEAALAPVIRDRLRAYIPVDPALVLPDDKLCEELQLAVVDGLDANAFMMDIERAVGTKIPDRDAQAMFTLRDIVSYVAARKQ